MPTLPAVRLQSLPVVPTEDLDGVAQDSVLLELPPSNKFGFAWPDSSPSVSSDQPFSFSSSDVDETDTSEAESFAPSQVDSDDEGERSTPTHNMDSDTNPLENLSPTPPVPRLPLSRAFSMPSPSQLRHLRNPRRAVPSPDGEWNTRPVELSPEFSHFHELSLELADSVQAAIQTLLQLSPPQLLDHAKEQLSGCSVSVPTPSMSAMFTCMKNLNYMSANMSAFSKEPTNFKPQNPAMPVRSSSPTRPMALETHFDIGEMLQSVGDSLSGLAAQAGVDLVLFHQDVGMKHVAVKGDESGLSYTLSYIVRQIIGSALRGDSVEVGLFIESIPRHGKDHLDDLEELEAPSELPSASTLRCTFYVAHRFSASEPSYRPSSNPPSPTIPCAPSPDPSAGTSRPAPSFKTIIMKRLLRQINGEFISNLPPVAFSEGRGNELIVNLELGSVAEKPFVTDGPVLINVQVSDEPSLNELAQFSETLKGKKATLFANSQGSFAHHLSSYLTAWGLDVSHVSMDPQNPGGSMVPSTPAPEPYIFPQSSVTTTTIATTLANESSLPPSFILIDDDVDALKTRLEKLRLESATQSPLQSKRRPTLSHRPKSSPLLPRGGGNFNLNPASQNTVIVHFTSLGNYKRVKDTIQQVLINTSAFTSQLPEVIVIPKPAGPRRVLTALYTATKKPIVDPFFMPIATSPVTPSVHAPGSFLSERRRSTSGSGSGHESRPSSGHRTNSDRSNKSPKNVSTDITHLPSSPLAVSDSMEYFSEAAVKLGASPSSGMVIQSPNGQPAGIFFHPGARGGGGMGLGLNMPKTSTNSSPVVERVTLSSTPRRISDDTRSPQNAVAYFPTIEATRIDLNRRGSRPPMSATVSDASSTGDRAVEPPASASPQQASMNSMQRKQSGGPFDQSSSSPPISPGGRSPALGTARRGANGRRITTGEAAKPTTPPVSVPGKRVKVTQEGNIVPPISVLIVDDNPINQTILSTFMRKKKIKYDVAKNGEEAVQKWKSGVFHLILMDIQMPVMDGIQATKEIRRMEKLNGAVGFPGTPMSEGPTTPSDHSSDSRSASTPYRSSVIIVALTASSLQSDRVNALAAGCNDFLTKPVSLHWLNSKIIEWGSIKALQMWADIRPEVVKNFSNGQVAQAQNVARRLHVPEGKSTPTGSRSRSSSLSKPVPGSRLASPARRGKILEIDSSPETEEPPATPVEPAEHRFPNTNNDIVSLDEEYLPPRDPPAPDSKAEGIHEANGEMHPPTVEDQ